MQPACQVPLSRKWWIVGIGLAVLLVGMVVAATLIGVYMTQKHTEKMVTLFYDTRDGQRIQQTISVNEQENMAAIFVSSRNDSTAVLYDYRRNLIGIRTMNSSVCYVLRMDRSQTPSIQDILREMDNIKTRNASRGDHMTYGVIPEGKANPIDVGMCVNILCSDVDIYWAKLERPERVRKFKLKIKLKIIIILNIKIGRKKRK
ncbi:pulmonary surfactant-associated protein C-like isoform X2 [Hyla sarda]|uniref:pulmonary surfactant-associated protein C-like isoform X2 n=1 Tax=Hyla sarda TaxID=327740 RepID=UPI0024C2DE44|nr:pulmonary surfactant-associated protein C-like isoform X2 [Hyla sarda]